jgi:DNA-directed RNA polymerase sigma subunit (sigma70/sigma32)
MPLSKRKHNHDTSAHRSLNELGARLAAALPELRTQKDVAAELGISAQAVGQIERRALAKLAQAILSDV